jgi:hypothetical protein
VLNNGNILVCGGINGAGVKTASCEMYTTYVTNAWSNVASMITGRALHQAVLLSNGKVLVVGGIGLTGNVLTAAEIYDPVLNTWSSAGALSVARVGFSVSVMNNGDVMVVGGAGVSTATGSSTPTLSGLSSSLLTLERYDNTTATWSLTTRSGAALPALVSSRFQHAASVLASGDIFFSGGVNDPGTTPPLNSSSSTGSGPTSTGRSGSTRTHSHSAAVAIAIPCLAAMFIRLG